VRRWIAHYYCDEACHHVSDQNRQNARRPIVTEMAVLTFMLQVDECEELLQPVAHDARYSLQAIMRLRVSDVMIIV
jgi:hypothetical protein